MLPPSEHADSPFRPAAHAPEAGGMAPGIGCPAEVSSAGLGDRPVSYRTFKHLLGETSLERKCRFIFGGGILALVTSSFYLYGQKTEGLVVGQMTEAARVLVEPVVSLHHTKYFGKDLESFWDDMA